MPRFERATFRRRLPRLELLEARQLLTGTPISGLGIAGDSLSDEYSETSSSEDYQYARSWTQLLVQEEGVNAGPTGSWGEPRRSGYEYNWARFGAQSDTLLSQQQHTGLAAQIDAGLISHAVLAIGQNDFNPLLGRYIEIYSGSWTPTQINAYADSVVNNVATALSALAPKDAHLVVSNIVDYGVSPAVRSFFNNPTLRDRVTVVIEGINARIATLADDANVPLVDLNGIARFFFGTNQSPAVSQPIGGVAINNAAGTAATNAFVHDGIHPHTVVQAQIANLVLEAFHLAYDTPIDPFSEEETLDLVGLTYGGSDTLNIDFATYVDLPNNAVPVLGLPDSVNYVENSTLLVSPSATVVDSDNLNFAHGELSIALAGHTPQDRVRIRHQGTAAGQVGVVGSNVTFGGVVIGSYTEGAGATPLQVVFNSRADRANVQAVLRNVTFSVLSDNPTSATRTLSVALSDGDGGTSAISTIDVSVSPTNDQPRILLFDGIRTFVEDGPIVHLSPNARIVDADFADFAAGELTVQVATNAEASDRLLIRHQGSTVGRIGVAGNTVSYGGTPIGTFTLGIGSTPLVVSLNANVDLAAVQALVRNIVFRHVSQNPSSAPRQVSLQLTDGDGSTSPLGFKQVNVTPTNDAPVIGGGGGTVGYTRNAAPIALLNNATLTDFDSPNFEGGSLHVAIGAGGHESNRLVLAGGFTFVGDSIVRGGVTIGTRNMGGGVGTTDLTITLNANANLSLVRQLLQAVRFRTTGPSSITQRVIGFTLNDGDGGVSNTASVNVNVT